MKIRVFALAVGLLVLAMISFNCGSCGEGAQQGAVAKPAEKTKKITNRNMDRSKAVRRVQPMIPGGARAKRPMRRTPDGKPVMRVIQPNQSVGAGRPVKGQRINPAKPRRIDPKSMKARPGKKATKGKKDRRAFQRTLNSPPPANQ